jgi:hypothetical protein
MTEVVGCRSSVVGQEGRADVCRVERLDGWEGRLFDYLKDAAPRPAKWGRNDCVLFACDAVEAMTGVDLVAEIRGKYKSRAGAVLEIAAVAGRRSSVVGEWKPSLEEAIEVVAAEFGLQEIAPAFARRGDLLIADRENEGPTLGIVDFDGVHGLFAGKRHVERVPVLKCRRALAVGRRG